MWNKLEEIYQSKGPARKATMLKKLTRTKMEEDGDIKHHLDSFFDVKDKLDEMNVEVNDDLLSIMLLDSLPENFENFRCAIESRDDLPKPDDLRIKIIEEYQARMSKREEDVPNAMIAKSSYRKGKEQNKNTHEKSNYRTKLICYRCKQAGHRAAVCRAPAPAMDESVAELAGTIREFALHSTPNVRCYDLNQWCLDSGATSHMTSNAEKMKNLKKISKPLCLANNQRTFITGVGEINVQNQNGLTQKLVDTFYVPDLKMNLMSVAKIVDSGCKIIFEPRTATILSDKDEVLQVANRHGNLYFIESANLVVESQKS